MTFKTLLPPLPLPNILALLTAGIVSGCGFEVENPGNPEPKPKTTTDGAAKGGASGPDSAPAGSPDMSVNPPCTFTVSKGTVNSSQTVGAKISLPQNSTYAGKTLVWRNPSSKMDENVSDLVFGSSSLPAATYEFTFSTGNYSCTASVALTDGDIINNLKLTLDIFFP
ncbi:MAG: hypothetical protein EBR09_02960 [Proteobacteria bacterium]|nr:hypothetical protein [Pseudomonadota bacterium]